MSREDVPKPVGYKRPPQHSQFKKGKSGNPSGRRKAKPRLNLLEELDKVLAEPIIVTKNGKPHKIPRLTAFAHKLVDGALKTDGRLMVLVVKLMLERQARSAQAETLSSEQDETLIEEALLRFASSKAGGHA